MYYLKIHLFNDPNTPLSTATVLKVYTLFFFDVLKSRDKIVESLRLPVVPDISTIFLEDEPKMTPLERQFTNLRIEGDEIWGTFRFEEDRTTVGIQGEVYPGKQADELDFVITKLECYEFT